MLAQLMHTRVARPSRTRTVFAVVIDRTVRFELSAVRGAAPVKGMYCLRLVEAAQRVAAPAHHRRYSGREIAGICGQPAALE